MDVGDINIKRLETGANVTFGLALAVYAELADALFPNVPVDVIAIEKCLVDHNVKISRRRLYELNQYRACVKEDWFKENLLRDEIRALRQAADSGQASIGDSTTSHTPLDTSDPHLIIAHKMADAAGFRLTQGEHCPYVVHSSSIKRQDPRGATIAFALLLAIPIFSGDRQPYLPLLDQAKAWPEPILTDTLEIFIIELAKRIGYNPAWALTSGSRIIHEPYIEPWIGKDYLTLLGIKNRDK